MDCGWAALFVSLNVALLTTLMMLCLSYSYRFDIDYFILVKVVNVKRFDVISKCILCE